MLENIESWTAAHLILWVVQLTLFVSGGLSMIVPSLMRLSAEERRKMFPVASAFFLSSIAFGELWR